MCNFLDDLGRIAYEQCLALGISEETAQLVGSAVPRQIGRDYNGERPYIGKGAEASRDMSARNRAIIRDWKAGERVALLARRYGISRQHVWRVIKGV